MGRSATPYNLGRGVLERKEKKVFLNGSFAERPCVAHMFNHGWWQLAVGGWWRLAVGDGRLVVVGGGWWWLAAGMDLTGGGGVSLPPPPLL